MESFGVQAKPSKGGSGVSHRDRIRRQVLSNGIILLMAPNDALPAISMNVVIGYGGRYESNDHAGLASLLGDMLDEGTDKYTAQEIALMVEEVGARWGTFGGYTHSGIALTALKGEFHRLLQLSGETLMNSTFPEERVAQRRERRLAQLKSRQDDPRTVASDAFNDLIYGREHPAHRPTIGYPETVAILSRTDLLATYHTFFVPNNTLIAVAGDFVASELVEQIETVFADWKPHDISFPTVPLVERQTQAIEKTIFKEKEQIQIYLGHLGITRNNPDFYALLVMDTILGSSPGMTSRIPRILRDEQGLAYTTFASITGSAGVDPGRFTAYIGTSPANREKAVSGLRAEIARIIQEPVDPQELEMAQSYLTGSFVFNFETNAQMAGFLVEAETFTLGFDYLERYPELIRQVTVEDINRVSQKYLDADTLTTVIVGPIRT